MDTDPTQSSKPNVAPKRQPSSRRLIIVAIGATVFGVVLGGVGTRLTMSGHGSHGGDSITAPAKKAPLYQCPMHPAITSDHPGDCPICGMKLVLVTPAAESGA